jgi:AcrR family transcriptional regulator
VAGEHAVGRRRPAHRLTRKEQQARTRAGLMHSAARVFGRRGLERASVDEIAEDAGFTKGAFYANFASKEEIFLAMLDERFAERLAEIERVTASDAEPQEQAMQAGADFERFLRADPEWQRLFFEFAAYAARNEVFRGELVRRYRMLQERIAEAYRRRIERLGVVLPIPVEQVAAMTFAMANGVAFEMLLDPDALPGDAFGTMMSAFFSGLRLHEPG